MNKSYKYIIFFLALIFLPENCVGSYQRLFPFLRKMNKKDFKKRSFHRRSYSRFYSHLGANNIKRLLLNFYKRHQKKIKRVAVGGAVVGTPIALKYLYELKFGKWGEENGIQDSLSYKVGKSLSWWSIRTFLQQLTKGEIKDVDFAMQQIKNALIREQEAQKNGELVLYHAMPQEIYATLKLYTILYREESNQSTAENDFLFRSLNVIENTKGANNGIDFYISTKGAADNNLVSFDAFLFAGEIPGKLGGESVFTRKAGNYSIYITKNLITDICGLYKITDEQCAKEILKLLSEHVGYKIDDQWISGEKTIILQLFFPPNNTESLEKVKKSLKKDSKDFRVDDVYVGYDENHVFPNFFWAQPGAVPSTLPFWSSERYQYNGVKMFHDIRSTDPEEQNRALLDAQKSQITWIPMRKDFAPGGYTTRIIDVDKQFQDHVAKEKQLKKRAKEIISKYKPGIEQVPQSWGTKFWKLLGY